MQIYVQVPSAVVILEMPELSSQENMLMLYQYLQYLPNKLLIPFMIDSGK